MFALILLFAPHRISIRRQQQQVLKDTEHKLKDIPTVTVVSQVQFPTFQISCYF
jgi:hypothetical protein